MSKLTQFLLYLLAVVLGLLLVIFSWSLLSDPVDHDDLVAELELLRTQSARNECLILGFQDGELGLEEIASCSNGGLEE